MVFVSYAQNYEDVMLARAFGSVEDGFYIDVGAQDPDEDSVTKHFYDLGWRGMNFEPSERYHARLEAVRPRDVNLRCAVGDRPGSVTFYEADGTGLSTIVEAVSAATSEACTPHIVPMTTLDAACAAYGITTVHFLKIDVEGGEELVLRGTGFEAVRPWIVLLEATHPNSPEPYYAHWEPLLTEHGYRFVYADGLNRFYLADEHADLAHHFEVPPNHFDHFVRASEIRADERAEKRWADNLAHHLKIIEDIDADRGRRQAVLDEHAGRIETLTAQLAGKEEVIVHHLGLIEEAAARMETLQAEIERLASLVEAGSVRERETIAHHLGLIEDAAARAETLQTEIGRLSESLENETVARDRRIAEAEALAEHRARQIAFRDDKIGWLSLDRDRYRAAHRTLVESRLWRLTRPLQTATLRGATRARPLVRALPPEPEAGRAPPHASDTAVAPAPIAEASVAAVLKPGEVPDRALWLQNRLFAA